MSMARPPVLTHFTQADISRSSSWPFSTQAASIAQSAFARRTKLASLFDVQVATERQETCHRTFFERLSAAHGGTHHSPLSC